MNDMNLERARAMVSSIDDYREHNTPNHYLWEWAHTVRAKLERLIKRLAA